MSAYGIYEAAGYAEPVIVEAYADAAGRNLPATLLPHERQQQAAYAIVLRNAGAGARQLVEAGRVHTGELGSCDVMRDPVSHHRQLLCVTCGVWSEQAPIAIKALA